MTQNSPSPVRLGAITSNASKLGTGVTMATAISEGDFEGASKALSMEIINAYPLGRMFNAAAEITDRQINRWKDQEVEAAYQVFKNGAESKIPFYGYNVKKGDFNALWDQMRGIQTKIYSDAIKDYAAARDIDVNSLDEATQNSIRREARNTLESEFSKRLDDEKAIKAIEEDHLKLLNAFEKANLFEEDLYGFTEATSFEFRMERLYKIKDMILKDSGASMARSDSTRKKELSYETIAKLARLWYSSDNGKENYRKQLIELGYVDGVVEVTEEVAVEESTLVKDSGLDGGTLELLGEYDRKINAIVGIADAPYLGSIPVLHLGDLQMVVEDNNLIIEKSVGNGVYNRPHWTKPQFNFDFIVNDVNIAIDYYLGSDNALGDFGASYNYTFDEGEGGSYYHQSISAEYKECSVNLHMNPESTLADKQLPEGVFAMELWWVNDVSTVLLKNTQYGEGDDATIETTTIEDNYETPGYALLVYKVK